ISSQLTLNRGEVTVNGGGCATIRRTGSSGSIMVIGGTGNGNPNLGPAIALSATAAELSTTFTTASSLAVSPGDLVYLHEGGRDAIVSSVTAKNVQGAALLSRAAFGLSLSTVTVTGAGSAQCGDAVWLENQGEVSVNGMSIASLNPGASGTGCLFNGAFGMGTIAANGTISNVTVDAAGAYGRPFKTTSTRWTTFNALTVKNGVQNYNGL